MNTKYGPFHKSSVSDIEKLLEEKFRNLNLNTLNEEFEELEKINNHSDEEMNKIKWADRPTTSKYYYNKPTPMDVLIEENEYIFANSYNGKNIYEWNIDGFSDRQIYNTANRMLMYSTVCKSSGNTDKNIAKMITAGFTGQLKGWWDNYLHYSQKDEIFNSIKMENNIQSENVVYTLILTMIEHFCKGPKTSCLKNLRKIKNFLFKRS